jgi:O-antigen ligase
VLPAVAAGICAAGIVLAQSKGGIIAALVGLWWLGVAWWVKCRRRRIALYLLPLVAGAAAIGAAVAVDGPVVEKTLLSLRYRLDYWQATAGVLRQNGLAGVGLENFGLHYTEFKLPAAPEEIRDPHNLALSMWSSLGLAGLAALVGLVVVALRSWLPKRGFEVEPVTDSPAAPGVPKTSGMGGMPTPPLRGHVSGEAENMPSERRAGHATPGDCAVPESSGTPAAPAPAAPGHESLLALLAPTVVIAFVCLLALGFFEKALVGWLAAVLIAGPMMILMGLAPAEEPSRLGVSGRPLGVLMAGIVVALAALALMEQIGTAILEPPTAWAALVVLGVSLRLPRAKSYELSLGDDEIELTVAGQPGVGLGPWAKFAIMLLVMAACFACTRVLLVPFMREDALLAEAGRSADAAGKEPILRAAAAVNPLAWEPALMQGRAWQRQAASEPAQARSLSLEHALDAYQEAIARQPRLRQAYLGLAACRLTMPGAFVGDPEAWRAALGYVEEASRLYPTDIPTQAQKATLLDWLGENTRALAAYRLLLDLDRAMPDEGRRLHSEFRAAVEDRIRQLEADKGQT